MKICLISNLYKPYNKGGAEQVVENTIEGLKTQGKQVVLITTKPFKNLSSLRAKVSEENGVKTYRFYPLNLFSYINIDKHNILIRFFWHLFDIFNNHSYFVIKNILQREKPDIVHTHNLKGIGYLTPKAIKTLKIKHIHTLHDIQLASPSGLMIKNKENNWQQKGMPSKIYSLICKYLFNSVSTVISPSKWLMDYYKNKKFFNTSARVIIRNPINKKEIIQSSLESQQHSKDIVNFLFIGQIEKHKGILFLINAFNSLKELNIKLDIIGSGSQLENAKKISKNDNISFYGKLPHKETLEKITTTNFVIAPSLCYENSPNIVIEALNAGKPVITADIGGTAELININNGYKFEAGNKEDLINKIKLAMENINNFNSNTIRETINGLSLENYIEKLINLYKIK
jgi:glycosyltransferase involved in cell wall biosynthesis